MRPEKLIALFNAHEVRYLIIGAAACAMHGFARATKDLDLFIEATPENARRVLAALSEFGYDVTDLTVEDVLKFKLLFRKYWLDADIHPEVTGATFKTAWPHRVKAGMEGVPAFYVSLDDLIRMKRSAGRPKDLEDLKNLLHLKKLKKKRKGRRRS